MGCCGSGELSSDSPPLGREDDLTAVESQEGSLGTPVILHAGEEIGRVREALHRQRATDPLVGRELEVLLPGESEKRTIVKGEQFIVPANEKFDVKVAQETIYTCRYE